MFDEKDGYLGFTFAGHHSSEFGLLVVSDGSRYHQNLFSNFSDTVTQVPGKSGGYYFGTQIGMRDFDVQCVFDNMNSHMKQKIEQWLYPNKTGWIIFDEAPYKKYYVKISQVPQFNFIPFDEFKNKKTLRFQRDIFKGELNISFFSFYEYGIENEDYDLPSFNSNDIIKQHMVDSGLLPNSYQINNDWLITTNNNTSSTVNISSINEVSITSGLAIYNAGNGIANADFYFTINSSDISENNPLIIYNYDDGNDYILNDPTNIIKQQTNNTVNFPCDYRIEILGSKKEVWVTCVSGNNESNKINIGGCYNHYFPKIYHKKPSDIMMINQPIGPKSEESASNYPEGWNGEPIFYSYSWDTENNFISSDSNGIIKSNFEEIQSEWSDYTILTENGPYAINNIINPATIFFSDPNNNILQEDSLVFLIYPNKFSSNKTLRNFTAKYKNTYI